MLLWCFQTYKLHFSHFPKKWCYCNNPIIGSGQYIITPISQATNSLRIEKTPMKVRENFWISARRMFFSFGSRVHVSLGCVFWAGEFLWMLVQNFLLWNRHKYAFLLVTSFVTPQISRASVLCSLLLPRRVLDCSFWEETSSGPGTVGLCLAFPGVLSCMQWLLSKHQQEMMYSCSAWLGNVQQQGTE